MNNAWFHDERALLFRPWASWDLASEAREGWASSHARDMRTVRVIQHGSAAALRGQSEATQRMLKRLPERQELATRCHMQLFRSCLEATSLVPSDELMHAAVQLEWLWYTTPFKRFYRDHLAHVMKVATIALKLWRTDGLLCDQGRLVDAVAARLARREAGSALLRRTALRLGNDEDTLRSPAFWKQAVLEATRLACLLHDLAYPSIMSGKYVTPAAAITDPIGAPNDEREHLARHSLRLAEGRLLMAPFLSSDPEQRQTRSTKGDDAFTEMVLTSHSLQAGLRILQFGAEADRIWRLTPLEAFVIEWAAAASALHDYDKAYVLHLEALARARVQTESRRSGHHAEPSPLASWFDASPSGVAHADRIRPSLDRDPVSYMVALADQLQDFGRLNLDASQRAQLTASLQISVPVQDVTLRRRGKALQITWTITQGADQRVRGEVRNGKLGNPSEATVEKRRGAAGVIFWPPSPEERSWLDHGAWFESVILHVVEPEPDAVPQ